MEKRKPNFNNPVKHEGQLYEPGEVILTEGERKVLEMAGWKKGDPLPGKEFASAVQAVKQAAEVEFEEEAKRLAESGRPPLKVMNKPIGSLPPEKQNELKKILERSLKYQQEIAAAQENSNIDPALAKAIHEVATPATKKQNEQPKPAPEIKKVEVAPEPKEEPAKKDMPFGDLNQQLQCKHCGWILSNEVTEKPTKNDTFLFVQALLGGKPFEKEYSLFSDKLQIKYRTIPVDLGDMCLRQCALDTASDKIKTQDEFFNYLANYRLIASIHSLKVNEVEHAVGESVDDYITQNKEELGKKTPLAELLPSLRSLAPLNQEPVWRMVVKNYQRFSALVNFLEARADDADFYQAIDASS